MAAAALKKAAEELGYQIKVETQGSVGAKNTLTEDDIRSADAAIIAANTHVDASRFAAARLYTTSTKEAIHHGKDLIAKALALPAPANGAVGAASKNGGGEAVTVQKRERRGAYKHLMTGVSHMLPLVTAGGLLIAIAFAVGGIHAGDQAGTLGWALMQIGASTAFKLYIPVLAAFIAFSIADRPGLCPGLVGGMLSMNLGAGFLGGIIAGFLAGYITKLINDRLPLPSSLTGLKPVLILPVLSTLIVGMAMIFVIGNPVRLVFADLTAWLSGMQQGSALLLGALLAGMMAFDMGGPVNKAAYTFSVGMLASNVHGPMAATMAGGMTPPLGIALAALLFGRKFTQSERNQSKVTAILGLSFITEGAIPYAAADPLRVIPCLVAGSALTGAIAMASGCGLMVPHGGVFVLFIPNAVTALGHYALAIAAGTLLTGLSLGLFKPRSV
jgi:PTS system fructose-specific IIC component